MTRLPRSNFQPTNFNIFNSLKKTSFILCLCWITFCLLPAELQAQQKDEFLHDLYDQLHDSPAQQKFRKIAPMPFGVVFLPWEGMTEEDMRWHFRKMKEVGFHNLKQTMPSPEFSTRRILEVALEEDVIPFWYGEGGWEAITPQLLNKLGIPKDLPLSEVRKHPEMLSYQKEVLYQQLPPEEDEQNSPEQENGVAAFEHVPDPTLRPADEPFFEQWLKQEYGTIEALNRAWNFYEVGIGQPYESWEALENDNLAEAMNSRSTSGREYRRIRDVLRFKADMKAKEALEERLDQRTHPMAPIRAGGEMGLFLPFAWRATDMEDIADQMTEYGSFYPSIHFAWHFWEVEYEVARPLYMQSSFAADMFKGGWSATWESTGGPQQLSGGKGWEVKDQNEFPGFTVNAGTITQQFLSYLAAGFKGAGVWTWNFRNAGWEAGEYALLNRQNLPGERAIKAGKIAQAAERLRDEIWQAHKEPYVGVLVNWESDAYWAAASVRGREHFKHYPIYARVGISRALINGNIPWEHVTVDDLSNGLAPRYKAIYLPAQLSLSEELLDLLLKYAREGGRVILDAPGGWYDETGKVLFTGKGSKFEQLFGAEIADFQYSNNVPRYLDEQLLDGFIYDLNPTSAQVVKTFQTGEPAVTENKIGEGSSVILGFDASHSCFKPGADVVEENIRKFTLGGWESPYACEGAIVYRLAAPEADHYFFINDGPATEVTLDTKNYQYTAVSDPVSESALTLKAPISLEAYSGRWLRFEK